MKTQMHLSPGKSFPGRELAMQNSVFLKCSSRYWQQHKWQAALMLIGMALGVAVVFAVDIANSSAKRAFALSLDTVSGRTTHHIVGGTDGIDEKAYTRLRTELGVRSSAPIVQGPITLINGNTVITSESELRYTETLQLLGVDIFAEPMFRDQSLNDGSSENNTDPENPNRENTGNSNSTRNALKLLNRGSVILAQSTAERLGVQAGDTIPIKDSSLLLTLINTVDSDDQPGFESIAMVDISTAQEILGMQGRLSRIDIILPLTASSAAANSATLSNDSRDPQRSINFIESNIANVAVTDAERQRNSLTQMTEAFHTNLLAMSLLALLVGAFLIYNTVTLSVIQRRQTFGQLRAIGLQRHELFRSILTETLLFAIIGTLAGIVIGYMLGSVLLTLVTRTINDLYFTLDVRQVAFSGFTLFKAGLIGLGVSLLAALAPAIEASNSPPGTVIRRTTVERRLSSIVPVIFIVGVGLILAGIAILWLSNSSLWAGFIAIFCIVLGYSLMIPQALITITSLSNRIALTISSSKMARSKMASSAMGNYPLRSMTASLSRTAVAIAALAVSVSATAGVGIMIGSFRLSVEQWLGNTLDADVYISSASAESTPNNKLPESLLSQIAATKGINGVREARMTEVDTNIAPARLMAVRTSGNANLRYEFRPGSNQSRTPATDGVAKIITDQERLDLLKNSNAVIASEPFANKFNIKPGDTVSITSDNGIVPFEVAGVFTNYTTGKGLLIMAMDSYHKHWNDRQINSIGVNVSKNADPADVKESLRSLISGSTENEGITMRSNTDIRDRSLEIFDRTFAITHVLRLLTIGVAFVGILSALMALSLERRAEYAVLRSLGITPSELRKLLFMQTGLMGIIAGILALPLGVAMSKILVSIINVRSFGWSMEYAIPTNVLLESLVLAIIAALLAGLYPAHKLSRLSPAEALRHQ